MKKRLFVILICLTLMVNCTSFQMRAEYDTEVGRFWEIPYFPTFNGPYSENIGYRNALLTMSIIGIPYLIVDYTCSTVLDIVLLPFDVYRNKVVIPERSKYKKVQDELVAHYYDTLEKLDNAKTEKEKKLIKEEYKKSLDEYCDKLRELDPNFVFNTQPYYRYEIE